MLHDIILLVGVFGFVGVWSALMVFIADHTKSTVEEVGPLT